MNQCVRRKAIASVAILLLLVLAGGPADGQEKKMDPEKQKQELVKILKADLWGKELPAALARLPSWASPEVKEDKVAVFPHLIEGTRPFESSNEAKANLKKLETAMQVKPGKPRPQSQPLIQKHLGAAPSYRAEVRISLDDQKPRLAWVGPNLQFLKEGLTIAAVQQQLGRPEKVTRQVIQTDGDRRPVTLTLHLYAGGAVAFAESDLNPKPGVVDRALLDVPAVKAALFSED
jgi:hypothetical protein